MLLISLLGLEKKIKTNCLITRESRGIIGKYNIPIRTMLRAAAQVTKVTAEKAIEVKDPEVERKIDAAKKEYLDKKEKDVI